MCEKKEGKKKDLRRRKILPGPEVFQFLSFSASLFVLAARLREASFDRTLQSTVIVIVQGDKPESLPLPRERGEHLCFAENRPIPRKEHQLADRPRLYRLGYTQQPTC